MIFVVIIPGYVWVVLLLAAWATLACLASYRLTIRHRSMTALLVVTALQALSGMSMAIATEFDQIGAFACYGGAVGTLGSPVLTLIQTAVVIYLATIQSQDSLGSRRWFAIWVSTWVAFSLIAFLAHARSAALCTV